VTTGIRSGWIGDCSGWLYRQPTKIEQLLDRVVVVNQENVDAILKEIKTSQERMSQDGRSSTKDRFPP
jgi:hypothetical protein